MRKPVVVVFIILLTAASLGAQAITGSIFGDVRDGSGSAVVGAEVKLVNIARGEERRLQTNELGEFAFSGADPGEYRISVQSSGFKTLERSITLTASERLSAGSLVLELGAVQERVIVTAQGTAVQTVSSERSAAITSSQVEGLLIRGRSVTSLLSLLPGVVDPAVNQGDVPDGGSAGNYNVLGGRAASNNLTLDGITFMQNGGSPNAFFGVSMETISEVKVLLSNYQAEYGRLAGANIQMVAKSGTQEFHGAASYFKRHEQFNANNFFNNRLGVPKGLYRYNTWTYSVGGPIYIPGKFNRNRDKLFFFWNHEYWPQKSTNGLQFSTVPTALERAGDFSKSVDQNNRLIPVVDPTSRAPLPGNVVPRTQLDANGQALLKIFPAPNFLDTAISKGAYNHVTQWSDTSPFHLVTGKVNYNIRPQDALAGTFSASFISGTSTNNGVSTPFALSSNADDEGGEGLGIRYQHIFSPTTINEVTVGFVNSWHRFPLTAEALKPLQRDTYGFTAGSFNAANNPLNLMPAMSFGGVVGGAGLSWDRRFPQANARKVFDIADNLSKTIGSHTLKAGVFVERIVQDNGNQAINFAGVFDFGRNANNPIDSGYAYANAVLGVFNSYQEATSRQNPLIISRSADWFVQDNWRATRKLTFDYGIRFSWLEPFWQADNLLAGFVPGRFDPKQQVRLIYPAMDGTRKVGKDLVTGQIYPSPLIGFIAPGSGNLTNGMVIAADDHSYPRGLIANPGVVAAPRLGFAYDPFGNGKTAIRGGFGVFYDRPLGQIGDAATSYPMAQTPLVQFGTIATFRSAQGFVSAPGVVAWERNMKAATVMNFSFSLQRSIGFGTVIDAGYVGSLGRHLTWQRSLQNIPIGTRFDPRNADPTNTRVPLPDVFLRPIQGYSDIGYDEGDATSNYHSLQVTATRRFARNLDFGASWTWSKAMDFTDGPYGSVNTVAPLRSWNYGLAGFDRTHALKANWLWELPKHKWGFAPARAILNNWQVSGILTMQSGAPVSVGFSQVTAVDLIGTPSISPRIVVTGDPVLSKSERTFARNFNTSVFAIPASGTLGNAGKTLLRGPGINNWDIALVKGFVIRERFRVQFRSELYNAFNHTQFSAFNTTARFDAAGAQVNGQFGQFTAARNPRIIQLALKVHF